MTMREITARRGQIVDLARRYPVTDVRVFGSVVRGESKENSDVDFLVRMQPGCSLLHLGGLLQDLQALLGCPIDLVTEDGLKPRLRERILREAVVL